MQYIYRCRTYTWNIHGILYRLYMLGPARGRAEHSPAARRPRAVSKREAASPTRADSDPPGVTPYPGPAGAAKTRARRPATDHRRLSQDPALHRPAVQDGPPHQRSTRNSSYLCRHRQPGIELETRPGPGGPPPAAATSGCARVSAGAPATCATRVSLAANLLLINLSFSGWARSSPGSNGPARAHRVAPWN
jgi:hypothetical protein